MRGSFRKMRLVRCSKEGSDVTVGRKVGREGGKGDVQGRAYVRRGERTRVQ